MSKEPSLQEIFDALVERGEIPKVRVAPMRTNLKHYSRILGYESAAECPVKHYLKSDDVRRRLIEKHAPPNLSIHAVRNLKHDVKYVLGKAEELGLISRAALELVSWRDRKMNTMPRRNENIVCSAEDVLKPIPPSLEKEMADYERWSTKRINRNRPKSLRKRSISFSIHRKILLHLARYLMSKNIRANSIRLLDLIKPKNASDYIEWRIETQQRYTRGSSRSLACIIVLARYLETFALPAKKREIQHWIEELTAFRASLGAPAKVQDKSKRWLSLKELEIVGRSIYPLNARRVKELATITRARLQVEMNLPPGSKHRTFRIYALRVLQSLLIRLLVRIPFRQRNLREMAWNPTHPAEGRNLYTRDGAWRIRFRGEELKIAEVGGEEHFIEYEFPPDLVPLLEEWLHKWRPILIVRQRSEATRDERLNGDQEYVFLNSWGSPLSDHLLTRFFKTVTYKFTGVAVNPHMFRTIFATEIIKATNDFSLAAYMLGNRVKTVIDTYAYLLDEDCAKRASEWVTRRLQNESADSIDDQKESELPPLKYPRRR